MITAREEGDCPSAEALAAWMEGRGDATERAAVEQHVATCGTCVDVVAAALPSDDLTVAARAAQPAPVRARRWQPARWAIAATLAVTTAALAYGAVGIVVDRARSELARRASDALGQPVTIGRMRIGLTRGLDAIEIQLGDVRIGDAASTTADDVAVRVPLASLVTGAPVVSALRVVGPVIHLGSDSPITRGPGHSGGRHNAVAAAMGTVALEIVDGTLVIDAPGTPPLRIEHLAGTTTPTDGRVQIALNASTAGGPVSAAGELVLAADGPISLTIAGLQLTVAALPYAAGRMSGTADLSLRVTGTVHAPVLAGRALVRGGHAAGWNPLPSLLAAVAADGPRTALPPRNDLVFDELRVEIVSGPQGWRVPRLYVTSASLVVGADLDIDSEHALHGEGTVRLPATTATAVVNAAPSFAWLRDRDGTLTVPITIAGTLDAPEMTVAGERPAPPPAP